jgi:hypothetical protein
MLDLVNRRHPASVPVQATALTPAHYGLNLKGPMGARDLGARRPGRGWP